MGRERGRRGASRNNDIYYVIYIVIVRNVIILDVILNVIFFVIFQNSSFFRFIAIAIHFPEVHTLDCRAHAALDWYALILGPALLGRANFKPWFPANIWNLAIPPGFQTLQRKEHENDKR